VALDLLMINLRYHIVSLVAVFLALAIGVIAGTTVINDQVVKELERSDRALRTALATQQDANTALKSQIAIFNTWGEAIAKKLEKDQLRGRNVVMILSNGVDGKIVANVQDALTAAGATRAGTITFSNRWNLADDGTRQQLGSVLGLGSSATTTDIATGGAQRIATRLDTPSDTSTAGDLLQALSQSGFIQISNAAAGAFPPAGSLIVWLSSGNLNPSPPDGQVSLPLLRALAAHMAVVVGEPLNAADSLSDQIHGDATLSRSVATVDHVDTIPGLAGLVTGLHDVAAGLPAPHYGRRSGTTAVAPTP
jgi:hypothetical protein